MDFTTSSRGRRQDFQQPRFFFCRRISQRVFVIVGRGDCFDKGLSNLLRCLAIERAIERQHSAERRNRICLKCRR